ncbi:MAG TPA: GNAT family N-acetyltransferase [Tepidiformaceae bacterium]|nr:GNAT family N-acetyltransferase [Tepidiformaceae bacterium]
MTWRIGPAEACDAVAINRVVNLAYRVEDFFKVGDRTDVREVAEYLFTETFLVARDEDETIVGAVRVNVEGERGHFGMLSVDPAQQGTGLGRALIEAAERFCAERGCTWMDLEVASPRSELPPLYRKFGYEVSGEAPWPDEALDELKTPAHFVVMSKRLTAVLEESHG